MIFQIGELNIVPYIAYQGLKWQREDVDGPNAGRVMKNARLQRDRIATKIRWDVTCVPLKSEELARILQAIKPEYVYVTYTDPETNRVATSTFYSNNFPVSYCIRRKDGTEYWSGLTFPVIQV